MIPGVSDSITRSLVDLCSDIPEPLPLRKAAISLYMEPRLDFRGHSARLVAAAYIVMAARTCGRADITPQFMNTTFDIRASHINRTIREIQRETHLRISPVTAEQMIESAMDALEVPDRQKEAVSKYALLVIDHLRSQKDLSTVSAVATGVYLGCQRNCLWRSQDMVCIAMNIGGSRATIGRYAKIFREMEGGRRKPTST